MNYLVVGLGNPGGEYDKTRHNVGFLVLDSLSDEWEIDKLAKAEVSKERIASHTVHFAKPLTFMNKSGAAVSYLVQKIKVKPVNVIVIHDDLDLPLGAIKVSFNRGSGGHRGVESITRAIKTREFIRIRVGVSPETPGGKLRKPKGEEKVVSFILGKFKPPELLTLKKISKKIKGGLELLVTDGLPRAMNELN